MQDLSAKSVRNYHAQVRILGEYFGRDPAMLGEAEVREYFLYCRNVERYAPSTMNIKKVAFRCFFHGHLGIEPAWRVFTDLRIRHREKLPVVLTREEVKAVLDRVDRIQYHTILSLIYATGLRISEACALEVRDIDSVNGRLLVREGKGLKSRHVPLGEATIEQLRRWWKCHRNERLLFPATGTAWKRGGVGAGPDDRFAARCESLRISERTMPHDTVRNAMRWAVRESGVKKKATVHTLRHCFATHLLEEGVGIRQISAYLGHASLNQTLIYVHLSAVTEANTQEAMRALHEQVVGESAEAVVMR